MAFELTEAVRTELKRIWQSGPAWEAARLVRGTGGVLRLQPDRVRDGDVVLEPLAGVPPLVLATDLANEMNGGILHFNGPADDRYGQSGLVLLRPRPGAPRDQWAPPLHRRSRPLLATLWDRIQPHFRRRSAPASTTESASP